VTVYHVAAALLLGLAGGWLLRRLLRPSAPARAPSTRTILLPLAGPAISRRAFEAAVRLARAEDATIMPAYLARVPLNLPLEAPLPAQCLASMPLLEAIEQRATQEGVRVDSRIGRGRSYRDALQRLVAAEHFDRIIVSATAERHAGLEGRDVDWLLERAPAEVLILRPAPEDERRITSDEGDRAL
jgi:nucleotide-binding universal stress UspA family protein